MWQRWNQTTHIFEKSDDDGANWVPLPLDASILTEGTIPPSVLGGSLAYTNQQNLFTKRQTIHPTESEAIVKHTGLEIIGAYTGIDPLGHHACLIFTELANAADIKKWRIVVFQGQLSIERLNDAETAIPISALTIKSDGNIQTVSYIYPGRVDVPGKQLDWAIGSHGSYGLWTNTGMYFGGDIYAPSMTLGGYGVGVWNVYGIGAGNFWAEVAISPFSGVDAVYMIIGRTVFITYLFYLTLTGNSNYIYCHSPVNSVRQQWGMGTSNGPYTGPIYIYTTAGGQTLTIHRSTDYPYALPYFPPGAYAFYFQMFIQF